MPQDKTFDDVKKAIQEALKKVKDPSAKKLLENEGLFQMLAIAVNTVSPWIIEELESYRQGLIEKNPQVLPYFDAQIKYLTDTLNPEGKKSLPEMCALMIMVKLAERFKKLPKGAPVESAIVPLEEVLTIFAENSSGLVAVATNPKSVN